MITKEQFKEPTEGLSLTDRRAFMKLPLEERRGRLAEQADRAAEYYHSQTETSECDDWQGGDFTLG